jgi:hypothetical protein
VKIIENIIAIIYICGVYGTINYKKNKCCEEEKKRNDEIRRSTT